MPSSRTDARPLLAGLLLCLAAPAATAQSAGDQWYIGIGGGGAFLDPDTVSGVSASDDPTAAGTLLLGRDLDNRSSVQLQLHALGDVDFDNSDGALDGQTATYSAADVSVLYRFFDTRDSRSSGNLGLSVFGRFGLGYLDRDSDLELEGVEDVFFGAGGGIELYLTRNIGVRAEGLFIDTDAAVGYLSLIGRFGGQVRRPPVPTAPPVPTRPATPAAPDTPDFSSAPATSGIPPTPPLPDIPGTRDVPGRPDAPLAPDTPARPDTPVVPDTPARPDTPALPDTPAVGGDPAVPALPQVQVAPVTAPSASDTDGDGVANTDDICPQSAAGYPVQANGCALLDGVLTGVTFVDGTAELEPGASEQLDFLATTLLQYPDARIELHAHSDNRGTDRDQAVLTRGRLRTVGTYLLSKGVSASRLVLRSFGGSRPLFDNSTAQGRVDNNRIEIIENTR